MTTPLTEEQADLAARYYGMAKARGDRAARMYPACAEEVEGAAVLALMEAVRKYDPSRGVNFATWAIPTIDYRILDAVKATLCPSRDRRRETWFSPEVPEPWCVDPETDEAEVMLARLPAQEAAAVRAAVIGGQTLRDLGRDFGISATGAMRLVHRGLGRLRERIEALA